MIDPTTERLSKHFLLSDFLGSHSVYTRGYANSFDGLRGRDIDIRRNNGIALCEHALEPILEAQGPLSISYGFIRPEVSQQTVTYMDPNKPSHHRWDLGAAADICVHNWVNGDPNNNEVASSPIALALSLADSLPFSRMITYSESPYICIAVSDDEIRTGKYRRAFYENGYQGKPRAKPLYRQFSSDTQRERRYNELQEFGLNHGWRGAGYPTYHGGGRRQMQHVRVSKYTMISDWLFDLQSIANGAKNIPNFRDQKLWDTFCAVGDAYDEILEIAGVPRMSITAGFVSHTNPYFDPTNDWRSGTARFTLVPPEGMDVKEVQLRLCFGFNSNITGFGSDDKLEITVKL